MAAVKKHGGFLHEVGIPVWFRHKGIPESMENRAVATTSGLMLNHPPTQDNNDHVKCPDIFTNRAQARYKEGNPFSLHDNRNRLQSDGVYFWQGLGKHKVKDNVNLKNLDDIITWSRRKESDSHTINSLYREDYLGSRTKSFEGLPLPHHRRYAKHLPEAKPGAAPLSSTTTLWQPVNKMAEKNYFQLLADSQPIVKHTPWIYSYNAHSFSELPKPGRRRTRRPKKLSSY